MNLRKKFNLLLIVLGQIMKIWIDLRDQRRVGMRPSILLRLKSLKMKKKGEHLIMT